VPERVGLKVLPIPTKSRFIHRERPETVGEEQAPPCMYAGEASALCRDEQLIAFDGTLPRQSRARCRPDSVLTKVPFGSRIQHIGSTSHLVSQAGQTMV
jgi:hypothetical protein